MPSQFIISNRAAHYFYSIKTARQHPSTYSQQYLLTPHPTPHPHMYTLTYDLSRASTRNTYTHTHMNYDLSRASVRKLWSLLTASISAFKSFWRLHTKSNRSRGNLEGRRVTGIMAALWEALFSDVHRPDKWA